MCVVVTTLSYSCQNIVTISIFFSKIYYILLVIYYILEVLTTIIIVNIVTLTIKYSCDDFELYSIVTMTIFSSPCIFI